MVRTFDFLDLVVVENNHEELFETAFHHLVPTLKYIHLISWNLFIADGAIGHLWLLLSDLALFRDGLKLGWGCVRSRFVCQVCQVHQFTSYDCIFIVLGTFSEAWFYVSQWFRVQEWFNAHINN